MPTLKLTPYYLSPSLLLLAGKLPSFTCRLEHRELIIFIYFVATVASGVKGNTTTVTLFTVQPLETASAGNDGVVVVNNVSPISLLGNGATVYRENYTDIITSLELVILGTRCQ